MRASSRASKQAAIEVIENEASLPSGQALQVSGELFEISDLIEATPRIARAVTDPSRSPDDKRELVAKMFGSQVSKLTASILATLAQGRWAGDGDLPVVLKELSTQVLLQSANQEKVLEQVEREVFQVGQLLRENRRLRATLTDNQTGDLTKRVGLVRQLFSPKVHLLTGRLLEEQIATSKPGRLQSNLRGVCQIAAEIRAKSMATVISATALSEEQMNRIGAALKSSHGREMVLNTVIDPNLVGGIKIRFGDQVVDGSITNILSQTRRQLAG